MNLPLDILGVSSLIQISLQVSLNHVMFVNSLDVQECLKLLESEKQGMLSGLTKKTFSRGIELFWVTIKRSLVEYLLSSYVR